MRYEKEVVIDKRLYTFVLTEQCELMFYVIDPKRDKFSRFGDDNVTTANLHGSANVFKIFRQLKKFVRYIFNNNVGYFTFRCEPSRYSMYEYFINRLIQNTKYKATMDSNRHEFYVFKSQ
ncbi:MAG: hypothetical protein ACK5NC_10905 [Vibrio sp.]